MQAFQFNWVSVTMKMAATSFTFALLCVCVCVCVRVCVRVCVHEHANSTLFGCISPCFWHALILLIKQDEVLSCFYSRNPCIDR